MKRIFNAINNKHVRASVQSGLNGSSTLPTSGFTAMDNSTGASRAASELSARLDAALDEIDFEGDLRAQWTAGLESLDSKVAEYANSSLAFCRSAERWKCDRTEAEIIGLAWDCAEKAYKPDAANQRDGPERTGSRLEFSLSGSATGSVKTTTCTICTIPQQGQFGAGSSSSASYIVIAVCGTASKVDHVVNLHGEPKKADILLKNVKVDGTPETHLNIALHAHAGFLNSAMELVEPLSARIENLLEQNSRTNLLFTGHSAGGAVASLLCLFFRRKFTATFANVTFSCITFGSPPVAKCLSQEDKAALDKLTSRTRVLNIVNEFDLVARADRRYIQSLTELHNTVGPSEPTRGTAHDDIDADRDNRPRWPLPVPELEHIGSVIVLKVCPPPSDMEGRAPSLPGPLVSAWKITAEDLSGLIFCRLAVHSRLVYRDRIRQIESGCLNG